jgi:hypothetical protein
VDLFENFVKQTLPQKMEKEVSQRIWEDMMELMKEILPSDKIDTFRGLKEKASDLMRNAFRDLVPKLLQDYSGNRKSGIDESLTRFYGPPPATDNPTHLSPTATRAATPLTTSGYNRGINSSNTSMTRLSMDSSTSRLEVQTALGTTITTPSPDISRKSSFENVPVWQPDISNTNEGETPSPIPIDPRIESLPGAAGDPFARANALVAGEEQSSGILQPEAIPEKGIGEGNPSIFLNPVFDNFSLEDLVQEYGTGEYPP